MRQKLSLGSLKFNECKSITTNCVDENITFAPIELNDIVIEFEISAEEMLTQMKNVKTVCNGILEFYSVVKSEIASGEFASLMKGISDLR